TAKKAPARKNRRAPQKRPRLITGRILLIEASLPPPKRVLSRGWQEKTRKKSPRVSESQIAATAIFTLSTDRMILTVKNNHFEWLKRAGFIMVVNN
ncbi:MAG: hypothetical protein K2I74_00115, partial [Treponemataceae bacterium]|nr:hypothetical protein [Treponemataceae bacterium]